MSFGGSPNCTSCGKPAYHVEQVLGPGRKVYHKTCLKCQQCGKRLEQGAVVEHDLQDTLIKQPFCSRCHTQLFGTRDLRHGNHLPVASSPLRTPSRSRSPVPLSAAQSTPQPPVSPTTSRALPRPPQHATSPTTSRALPRPPASSTDFYTPPQLDQPASVRLDMPQSSADASTPITRPDFRSSRPISVPYAGGTKALDERGLLKRADSPRSKVGERILGEDMCEGCGKRVYAAEQINAIGYKWCLKCTTCKSTVDASKVTDKDNQVYCKNCYAKNFGPGGIMGKR